MEGLSSETRFEIVKRIILVYYDDDDDCYICKDERNMYLLESLDGDQSSGAGIMPTSNAHSPKLRRDGCFPK